MQLVAQGKDEVGNFEVRVPGYCFNCDVVVEASVRYPNRSQVAKSLEGRGIEFNDTRTHLILHSTKREVGVTCGCYARFHRQVAHISDKRKSKTEVEITRPV